MSGTLNVYTALKMYHVELLIVGIHTHTRENVHKLPQCQYFPASGSSSVWLNVTVKFFMFDMNRRLLLAAALTTLCASVHWTSNLLICHRFVSGYSLHGCQNPVKGPTPSIIIPLSHSVNTYQDF